MGWELPRSAPTVAAEEEEEKTTVGERAILHSRDGGGQADAHGRLVLWCLEQEDGSDKGVVFLLAFALA
uniref:Uncharacterized protein n=1 Tax=Oryza sativa subsp. japonica TaxID=39947 RepID=Q6H646_ORYSJ|nr:hypothetical protein [Oryza sativa Japonica Group]BAD25803.1 hypothetical protein [Oryza sativa Japonica Group]